MERAAQLFGDLGNGQPVQVAQGEGEPVWSREPRQRGMSRLGIEPVAPRIVELPHGQVGRGQAPLVPGDASPVVDELVARNPTSQATVTSGAPSRLVVATAAMKVSAVRSSATSALPQRGSW